MSDLIVCEVEVEVLWEGHRPITEADWVRAEKGMTIETELPSTAMSIHRADCLRTDRLAERMLNRTPVLNGVYRVVLHAPVLTDLVKAYEQSSEKGYGALRDCEGVYDFLHEALRIGGLTPDWTQETFLIQSWHRAVRVKP